MKKKARITGKPTRITEEHHGKPYRESTDWRTALADELDPDDELLPVTPEWVVAQLGFDPLEDDEDDDPSEAPRRKRSTRTRSRREREK